MDRHILGTFQNEEAAVSQVEKLIEEEGYTSSELMLVMEKNGENDKKIESIKNVKVNKVEVEEETIWDKVKEAFSFGTYDSEKDNDTLIEYGVPHNRLDQYTEALKAGEIVLLADTDAPKQSELSEVNEEVLENDGINPENEKLLTDKSAEETKALDHTHVSNTETTESKHLDDSVTPTQANDMRKENYSDNNKRTLDVSKEHTDLEKPELTGEEATVEREESEHAYKNKAQGVVKPKSENPLNTENQDKK
ncbi:general stress protein [Alkalibacterium kapii]|uniref:General stress protein 17M-like domain-containing protein n=1 Tax=Alkalibacterium kapii TaxID=426704 RepID=A0A511ARN7_9LACT|nr:general stress protein [Alkalibacterium kapii]GEK90870.1 hypothetical protein AKA01nite_04920 [Alkalibacterium kapii]